MTAKITENKHVLTLDYRHH